MKDWAQENFDDQRRRLHEEMGVSDKTVGMEPKVRPEAERVPEQGQIDKILTERGGRYGPYMSHAQITQDLKDVMHTTPGWNRLNAGQKEALDMTAHKIGRILNGDPNYDDSWVDIVGYTQLVVDDLHGIKR